MEGIAMELKGSKTEQNLIAAFAGESQARNKYTYFASVAKKEGYEQIAAIFQETADNEKEHAKMWFKELNGIGTTAENLLEAAEGELLEWSALYTDSAGIALDEGFKDISVAFKMIAKVEEFHEWRYRKLLSRLKDDTIFKREEPIKWQCRNCGFVYEGKTPPEKCPACLHPKAFFEPMRDNY
mgnify:CR=1 FL=1